MFHVEKWLLENNLVSEGTADTLLGYAYMQFGVDKVVLALNVEEIRRGGEPVVTYDLQLERSIASKYRSLRARAQRKKDGRGGLFNKLMMIWLLRRGAPAINAIESSISALCSNYLPKHYKVVVNVE
jgi:hypothetical protein